MAEGGTEIQPAYGKKSDIQRDGMSSDKSCECYSWLFMGAKIR